MVTGIKSTNIMRLIKNPYSTILGLIFIAAGFVFLFVETIIELPLFVILGLWIGGIMLLFAKDTLIEILKNRLK